MNQQHKAKIHHPFCGLGYDGILNACDLKARDKEAFMEMQLELKENFHGEDG